MRRRRAAVNPTRRVRATLLAVLLGLGLLSTSCGLPTDDGVHRAGQVTADVDRQGGVREFPPPPKPQASPADIVDGFLEAQISGDDGHAVSRSYLLPRTGWDDAAGVTVYENGPRTPVLMDGDPFGNGPLTYQVAFRQVGTVGRDGAASVLPPLRRTETFRLARDRAGDWRINALPEGLLLSTEDRDAAFTASTIYFLSARPGASTPHLVADRQLLPVGSGADALVRRVLAPPSSGLGDSGQTAAPPGTDLVSPVKIDTAGVEAVVDLTGPAAALVPSARDALAAQLVWTLRQVPDLLRLRLLVEGQPLLADRGGEPLQVRKAYEGADPQGNLQGASAVVDGQLRAVQGAVQSALPPAVRSATSVLDLAVDPRRGRVALLSGPAASPTLQVGSAEGPLTAVTAGPGLTSPTWGDGTYGVWLLRTGDAPAVLVTNGGAPRRVALKNLPVLDATATLRVSRDGSRLLVVSDGELLVARVVPPAAGSTGAAAQVPVLKDVRLLRPGGTLAADWLDGTTLAVLVSGTRPLLLASIDGVSQVAVNQPLQESRAQTIAALSALPVLVGAVAVPLDPPSKPPVAGRGSTPSTTPSTAPSATPSAVRPVTPSGPTPASTPEARLYAGTQGQQFLLTPLRDAVRPRYPG